MGRENLEIKRYVIRKSEVERERERKRETKMRKEKKEG